MISIIKNKKVFTVLEILVVISIIAFLATFTIIQVQKSQAKKRDTIRISDMNQINKALEIYFSKNNKYPVPPPAIDSSQISGEVGCWNGYIASKGGDNYIKEISDIIKLPHDPLIKEVDGAVICTPQYYYRSDGKDYKIISTGLEDFSYIQKNYPGLVTQIVLYGSAWTFRGVGYYTPGAALW